jgi:kinesin family protein 11
MMMMMMSISHQFKVCFVVYEQVDKHTSSTSHKKVISVPSLASIEEMRTNIREDNFIEKRLKWIEVEGKIQRLAENRTPFADVN